MESALRAPTTKKDSTRPKPTVGPVHARIPQTRMGRSPLFKVRRKMTVAKTVVEAFRDIGVSHIFGVPSGGWVDYMEAIRNTDGIEFVLTTHEGGAGFMADVCGRLTGLPGVCFGTYGPGATNLSTGVGSAFLDRSPVIALTDEMPEAYRGRVVQMGVDHQAIFAPLTKETTRLDKHQVRETIFDAAAIAMSGRGGPVHIGLPTNLSGKQPELVGEIQIKIPTSKAPDEQSLSAAMEKLLYAKKPILAVGLAAATPAYSALIREFAEQNSIPIVLTPMAKGVIPEDHPSYTGVLFHAMSDIVGEIHGTADLVVSIGYDPVEFNYENWLPGVPLISIDTEPVDIDRIQYPDVYEVIGDIGISLRFLNEISGLTSEWNMTDLEAHREKLFDLLAADYSKKFGPCAVLEVLRDVLPADGIMSCDVGAHTHLVGQKWLTPEPGLQIMTNGWSAMGFGIPAAIAAKLSRPNTPVCAVLGDGGFLMTVGELAVAERLKLNVVFVLLTDNDLALIRIKQQRKQNPIFGTIVRTKGTIGGDNLFGVPVVTATNPVEFETELSKAFNTEGPVVVEAIVDSSEYDTLVLHNDKS